MEARVLVFWEKDFPFADTFPIDVGKLIEALPPMESVRSVGLDELKERLRRDSVDLFINPYGSAFPKAAWPEIYHFLAGGGNLLNLGGSPFSVPVRREEDGWHEEMRQIAYHQELGITHVFPVGADAVKSYDTVSTEPLLSGLIEGFACDCVFELQVRFTTKDDHPGELGSSGTREAVLRPLLYGLDAAGNRLAAPVVAIDRILGNFAGGRWVLANFTASAMPRKEIIYRLAGFAALGPCDFQIRPSFACYYPEERAALAIHANRFETSDAAPKSISVYLTIRKDKIAIAHDNVEIEDFRSPYYQVVPLGFPLSPGLYTVEARLSTGDPELTDKFASHYETGFWCYDAASVNLTQPLSAGKDFFTRGDKPIPVVGTMYMASDVHRKFLFEPNAAVWDRDFAEMRAAGVNMVRTGIWTAFRRVMLDPGAPSEEVMRAATAFMLTAVKHDMPVIFTFFTFTPEAWEGENPYLDPRSLQAQKEFIAAFARRFGKFNNLIWDLINEPVFPTRGRKWSCRPNGDPFEERAWREWLAERYPSDDDLQVAWRETPRADRELPHASDFDDRHIFEGSHPMKALDYRLFAQEVFNRWAREMSAVIRQNGNPKQMITVGSPEVGAGFLLEVGAGFEIPPQLPGQRPNPQFHWKDVGFTCVHTWWLNDNLLWDGLMTKVPEKPNLAEETGIMFRENPDRTHRRSEEDCRNLLERKLVMAIASGGAGFIQWIWNTNVYMTSENEVGIGFHRADLTRKPEMEILGPISAFLKEARPHLIKRRPEDVCMVIPHSNMLSIRNHASAATRACVRIMHYHCGVPMRAVGEYTLENLGSPRLIVLPSAHTLSEMAWETLVKAMEGGATLLLTGPIDRDEYWRPVERLSKLGIQAETRPVAREEEAIIFGSEYRLAFSDEKVNRIDKAVLSEQMGSVVTKSVGSGKLIFAPLPFELADNPEPAAALYQFALKQATVPAPFSVEKMDPCVLIRPLVFADAVLYCVVSETDADKDFDLTDNLTGKKFPIHLPAQRALMLLLSREDGRVVAHYGAGAQKQASVPTPV